MSKLVSQQSGRLLSFGNHLVDHFPDAIETLVVVAVRFGHSQLSFLFGRDLFAADITVLPPAVRRLLRRVQVLAALRGNHVHVIEEAEVPLG